MLVNPLFLFIYFVVMLAEHYTDPMDTAIIVGSGLMVCSVSAMRSHWLNAGTRDGQCTTVTTTMLFLFHAEVTP